MKNRADLTLQNLNHNDIISVYSGRPGCACGCKGNHYYMPGLAQADYQVENKGQVTRILNVFQEAEENEPYRYVGNTERALALDNFAIPEDCPFICIDRETRIYVIYLQAYR